MLLVQHHFPHHTAHGFLFTREEKVVGSNFPFSQLISFVPLCAPFSPPMRYLPDANNWLRDPLDRDSKQSERWKNYGHTLPRDKPKTFFIHFEGEK